MTRTTYHQTRYREDPRASVDYFYQRLLEDLQKVRRMVEDVATSRKRLELQVNQVDQQAKKLKATMEDETTEGETRVRANAEASLRSINRSLENLLRQYEKASEKEQAAFEESLARQEHVDSFRTNKEAFKAEYIIATTMIPGSQANSPVDIISDDRAVELGAMRDLLSPDLMDISGSRDQKL